MSNVSSVVDYFATANEGFSTTLGSPGITAGATTVPLAGTSGLTNGTVFVGIIEPGATNQQVFTGIVNTGSSSITSVVWTRGTNVAHTTGVAIVDYTTGTAFNMMSAGILKQHTQTGTHTGLTTDTMNASGNAVVGGTLGVTGATTLTGAVGGAGYSIATMSNPYKFSAVAGAQSIPGSFTFTKVQFTGKAFDTNNNFDAVTNFRFTAPIAGFYFFTLSYSWFIVNGVIFGVAFYKNGSVARNAPQGQNTSGGNFNGIGGSVSTFFQLNTNDYIEAFLAQNGSGAGTLEGANLDGFLVSAT